MKPKQRLDALGYRVLSGEPPPVANEPTLSRAEAATELRALIARGAHFTSRGQRRRADELIDQLTKE